LVDASLDVFFCLVPPPVRNFDSVSKTLLQQTHLIQVLTPLSVQSYIIYGINFDKSIVIDILVGQASLEHLQPERNDHCLTFSVPQKPQILQSFAIL